MMVKHSIYADGATHLAQRQKSIVLSGVQSYRECTSRKQQTRRQMSALLLLLLQSPPLLYHRHSVGEPMGVHCSVSSFAAKYTPRAVRACEGRSHVIQPLETDIIKNICKNKSPGRGQLFQRFGLSDILLEDVHLHKTRNRTEERL